MSNRDALTAARVDELVRLAGGTDAVAQSLRVSSDEVVGWHFAGLDDATLAIHLVNLAAFATRPQGRPRRSALLDASDVKAAVERLGGVERAAEVLTVHPRTLRRYLRGDTLPGRDVADALRRVVHGLADEPGAEHGAQQARPRASWEQLQLVPPALTTPLVGSRASIRAKTSP
jgi:hypothetical protein